MRWKQLLHNRRYEFLLAGLLLHLFTGIIIQNPFYYSAIAWPLNIIVLGLAGFGVLAGKEKWKKIFQYVLFLPVFFLPLAAHYFRNVPAYFLFLSFVYVAFFLFLFRKVIMFLVKPGYINADIISAAACGSLLLVEISTFLFQALFYMNQASLKGVDAMYHTTVFNDMVYFSSITLTSIGFGDITPALPYTKLLTALVGITGQFYSVVLVSIVISKFVSRGNAK